MNKVNYLDCDKYQRNDIGMAKLFYDMFSDELLFCADTKTWYSWTGKIWEQDLSLRRYECAKIMFHEVIYALNSDPRYSDFSEITKFYLALSKKQTRDRIVDDAASINPVISSMFDTHKNLFNCKNGTYDFNTKEFREHRREDYLTRLSNVTYNPEATCPRFEKYLSEVMREDQSKIDYLMKIGAYCLTGDTSRECFFILYGDKTRNGKSTFVSTLTYLMGNYAETVKPATITRKNISTGGSNASPDIAKLQKSRLATVAELEDGMLLDISLIKTMTGGNALAARNLYSSEISFIPQFKILIDTNYLPKMTDDSIFNSDRIHILCFDRHFELEERDLSLKETLQNEVDGIFNLMISYLDVLKYRGFTVPQQSSETIQQYALTSNNVKQFTTELLYKKIGSFEKSSDVYKTYNEWCNENNYKVLGLKNFKQKLIDLGFIYTEKTRHTNDRGHSENTYWIANITLTEPDNPAEVRRAQRVPNDGYHAENITDFMKEIGAGDLPF